MLRYTKAYSGTGVRVWVENVPHNMSWAEFDFEGNLIRECERDDFLLPGLSPEEMQEAKEAIEKMRPAPYENAYLRFNDLPKGGKSRNYATGELEAGVSCYALSWDFVNQCYKRVGEGLESAMIGYTFMRVPVYLITGEECGRGSDGEPLLSNAKILASLKFDSEKDGYVGKDDTQRLNEEAARGNKGVKNRDSEADRLR